MVFVGIIRQSRFLRNIIAWRGISLRNFIFISERISFCEFLSNSQNFSKDNILSEYAKLGPVVSEDMQTPPPQKWPVIFRYDRFCIFPFVMHSGKKIVIT